MATTETTGLRSPHLLRWALGMVYFHFGVLKFFPDLSPGELLAGETLTRLTQQWLDARTAIWWLAVAECAIGLGLLLNAAMRWVFVLFVLHMIGTFLPLFVLPELTFKIAPLAPNLEGQYILKNLVFFAAGWTILYPAFLSGAARNRASPRSTSVPVEEPPS